MRIRTLLTPLAVITAAALALGGCGSSNGPEAQQAAATGAFNGLAGAPSYSEDLQGYLQYAADNLRTYWKDQLGPDYKDVQVLTPEASAETECGTIDATNTGPAYCPADMKMVLPLAFFRDSIIGADDSGRGKVAAAAVVGHEFGHHIQALIGVDEIATEIQDEVPEYANVVSTAVELYSDCLMGNWLGHTTGGAELDTTDVDQVIAALGRLSDDVILKQYGITVSEDDMDHGSRTLRQGWFAEGYDSDDIGVCEGIYDDLESGDLETMLQLEAEAANRKK